MRRTSTRGGHRRADRDHHHGRPSARQVSAAAARLRRRGDDPPPHERPGARRHRAGPSVHRTPMSSHRISDDGNELWFVDPRTFGEVVVFDPDERRRRGARRWLGSVSTRSSRASRLPLLRRCSAVAAAGLKPLLLDQHVIAGIGNIYADEILHAARLRPDRIRDELSHDVRAAPPRRDPRRCCQRRSPPAARRSATPSTSTCSVTGGSYQDAHAVYGRTGERCMTCGTGWIRRTVSAQRSTHFCPTASADLARGAHDGVARRSPTGGEARSACRGSRPGRWTVARSRFGPPCF